MRAFVDGYKGGTNWSCHNEELLQVSVQTGRQGQPYLGLGLLEVQVRRS